MGNFLGILYVKRRNVNVSSVVADTTTRFWPVIFLIFLAGLTLGAVFLLGCIVSDNLRERFCAKYLLTLFENT